MKKLKVTVGKNAPVRSFASLPEEQKDLQRFRKIKAMMCPCCGETMLLVDNVWVCQKCSYCIAQSDMLSGEIFWFCDHCGRFLNVQHGFLSLSGAWKCVACGFANDVSKDNIID